VVGASTLSVLSDIWKDHRDDVEREKARIAQTAVLNQLKDQAHLMARQSDSAERQVNALNALHNGMVMSTKQLAENTDALQNTAGRTNEMLLQADRLATPLKEIEFHFQFCLPDDPRWGLLPIINRRKPETKKEDVTTALQGLETLHFMLLFQGYSTLRSTVAPRRPDTLTFEATVNINNPAPYAYKLVENSNVTDLVYAGFTLKAGTKQWESLLDTNIESIPDLRNTELTLIVLAASCY
jgi:hypothetical protein